MGMGGMAMDSDIELAQRKLGRLLLSRFRLEDPRSYAEYLDFRLPIDPKKPPVVGIGVSEWKEGDRTLEFLTAAPEELFNFRKLLDSQGFKETPFHVTVTGRILAAARPAQGGDSVGHQNGDTGTLGCLVERDSGDWLVLSCNHVLAALNRGRRGQDQIWQPGMKDGGSSADRIGVLDDFKDLALNSSTTNTIDAALCRPDAKNQVRSGIRGLGQLNGSLSDPPYNTKVKKRGW